MKTVKSLSAVLALTVGMSAVAGVSALNFDWFGSAASAQGNKYFTFSYGQTDLDAKIAQLEKAWKNKEDQQKDVKELTKLRCDLLKAIAGTQFVYENHDKLKKVEIYVSGAQVDIAANVTRNGKYTQDANEQLKFVVPADIKLSEKDVEALKDALAAYNKANGEAATEDDAKAKVNVYSATVSANDVRGVKVGNKTKGDVVVDKVNELKALVEKVTSEEYKADVKLIELAKGSDKDALFTELTRLNNELNKLDDFVSTLTNLDAAIFDEACPIKFAGKLPVKDSAKAGEAKADAKADAKDNVPNTAAAAATASVAFASIFAAAAAVVAKRK